MIPVDRGQLLQVAGAHIGRAEFRTYATLLWIAKTLVVGYVLVSLQTKGGLAGVSAAMCNIPCRQHCWWQLFGRHRGLSSA